MQVTATLCGNNGESFVEIWSDARRLRSLLQRLERTAGVPEREVRRRAPAQRSGRQRVRCPVPRRAQDQAAATAERPASRDVPAWSPRQERPTDHDETSGRSGAAVPESRRRAQPPAGWQVFVDVGRPDCHFEWRTSSVRVHEYGRNDFWFRCLVHAGCFCVTFQGQGHRSKFKVKREQVFFQLPMHITRWLYILNRQMAASNVSPTALATSPVGEISSEGLYYSIQLYHHCAFISSGFSCKLVLVYSCSDQINYVLLANVNSRSRSLYAIAVPSVYRLSVCL